MAFSLSLQLSGFADIHTKGDMDKTKMGISGPCMISLAKIMHAERREKVERFDNGVGLERKGNQKLYQNTF